MGKKTKESKVEHAKKVSNYLRGTVVETLASDSPTFDHDDVQVLKFHGTYQQEDRDVRDAIKVTGGEKKHIFMIRCRIPGGLVTAGQYLALDELAERVTHNRSLRITTRQSFQFHGVLKDDVKPTIAGINKTLLSTLAACGDVARNIMATPAPLRDAGHQAVRDLTHAIADRMAPKTSAYHEIWLDGEKVASSEPDEPVEPIYGQSYLPRKFKVGVGLPEDNAIDVHSQCVGLIAILNGDKLRGVNVLVGGGFGMTHRKPQTYARLGTPLGFVSAENAVETVRIIAEMFRDHGDRTDRMHARLKYVVEEWGIEKFREEFRQRADFELSDWVEIGPLQYQDYLGVTEQGDGKMCYGLFIENGRILDGPDARTKTAIREIVQLLEPGIVLTPAQNILFTDLDPGDIEKVEKILHAYRVPTLDGLTGLRRYSMACPALPTCGLALAESEREMPGLMDELEEEFGRYGLEDEPVTVRMTGCPNGCARPYSADISFVGRKVGIYDINVGGCLSGDRMGELYAENVKREELIPRLHPLIEAWSRDRQPEEPLGDFYQRLFGSDDRKDRITGSKDNPGCDRVQPVTS